MVKDTVTMFDIARQAGVNQSTVSLALRDDPRIPAATRLRIAEAAKHLNYTPNHLARSLSGGRSRVIGVMLPDMINRFFLPHVQEIHAGAEAGGFTLSVKFCDWDSQREEGGLQQFCESRVEGVIWAPINRSEDDTIAKINKIQASGARCVILGPTEMGNVAPWVGVYESDAVRIGVEYLVGLGHRRIGIATATQIPGVRAQLHRHRLSMFCDAFRAAGVTINEADIYTTSDNEYGGVRIAAQIAAHGPSQRPTAVFAADDLLARGLIAGLSISGISVPGDVSVLGLDDAPGDTDGEVAITSVSPESREMGRQVIRLMLKQVTNRGAATSPQNIVLKPRIVERDSCRPPRR